MPHEDHITHTLNYIIDGEEGIFFQFQDVSDIGYTGQRLFQRQEFNVGRVT